MKRARKARPACRVRRCVCLPRPGERYCAVHVWIDRALSGRARKGEA
jgi:hypothetical protein